MIEAPRSSRILLVEDSDVQAIELKAILEGSGYDVIRAASAEAAMDILNRDVPDLIVADYQLPNMDGRELTRQLRLNERTRAVPIVLMCASGSRSSRAAAALRKAGHEKVVSLSGGLRAWRDANLPVEKSAARGGLPRGRPARAARLHHNAQP